MRQNPCSRTLIVGTGPAGLAALKVLSAEALPVEAVERNDDVGGLWYYGSHGSVGYRGLFMNSSRRTSEFPDLPMDESYPDFPSISDAHRYLRSYADHFALRERIQFQTSIER